MNPCRLLSTANCKPNHFDMKGGRNRLPSFLYLPQESSAPKSLGAKDSFSYLYGSFTAQTRRGLISVTGTEMRVVEKFTEAAA